MDNRRYTITVAICIFVLSTLGQSYASCPALKLLPGTVVQCNLPAENLTVNCQDPNAEIPRGTMAQYKCEKDADFSVSFLKCKCRGKWKGLRIFNDFMSSCNISDYSIDGPPELNLTERQIRQLALPLESGDNATGFQEDAVAYHNLYRDIHNSPPLMLNKTLSDAAQKWADQEVGMPELKTQNWTERSYSQNLYRFTGSTVDAREAVRLAVAAWYQGAYRYDWENPSGQSAFTQVVWKSTTDLGIGVAKQGNHTVVVANYWPPGNVVVENPKVSDRWAWFRENVLPPNQPSSSNETGSQVSTTVSSTSITITTMTSLSVDSSTEKSV